MGLRRFLRKLVERVKRVFRRKREVPQQAQVSSEPAEPEAHLPPTQPTHESATTKREARDVIRAEARYINVDVNVSFDTEDSRGRTYWIDFTIEEAIIPSDFDDSELQCLIEAAKRALLDEYPELEPLIESVDPSDVNIEVRSRYFAEIDHDRKANVELVIVEARKRAVRRRVYGTAFDYYHCFH